MAGGPLGMYCKCAASGSFRAPSLDANAVVGTLLATNLVQAQHQPWGNSAILLWLQMQQLQGSPRTKACGFSHGAVYLQIKGHAALQS